MSITISQGSIKTVKRLIRNEFDQRDGSMDFIYGKGKKLIKAAKDFGLNDLAEELENDINI